MKKIHKPAMWLGLSVQYLLLTALSISATIGTLFSGWLFILTAPIGIVVGAKIIKDFKEFRRYGLCEMEKEDYKRFGYKIIMIATIPFVWPYFVIVMKYFTLLVIIIYGLVIKINEGYITIFN